MKFHWKLFVMFRISRDFPRMKVVKFWSNVYECKMLMIKQFMIDETKTSDNK